MWITTKPVCKPYKIINKESDMKNTIMNRPTELLDQFLRKTCEPAIMPQVKSRVGNIINRNQSSITGYFVN